MFTQRANASQNWVRVNPYKDGTIRHTAEVFRHTEAVIRPTEEAFRRAEDAFRWRKWVIVWRFRVRPYSG